jgi:hypothetical protein
LVEIGGLGWACRADVFAWCNFLASVGGLYRMQIYRVDIPSFTSNCSGCFYFRFNHHFDYHFFNNILLITKAMKKKQVFSTTYQCYRRDFEKDNVSGEWEKCASSFEFGDNATQSMLTDGSGYYIDDPENHLQYFVDMKQSLTN